MNAITFDITEFMKKMTTAEKFSREAALRGVDLAMNDLLKDSQSLIPTVPMDTGHLRSTGASSAQKEAGDSETIVGQVTYNTPYAAYQHEGVRADGSHVVRNYTTPGSGKKYLETPLYTNAPKYAARVAKTIKAWLG